VKLLTIAILLWLTAICQASSSPDEPLATFAGTVKALDSKWLSIEDQGSNTLQFVCSRKTRYYDGSKQIKSSAIQPGDRVSVESRPRPDGALAAVNVHLEREKKDPS
jgi:hypothetical protein